MRLNALVLPLLACLALPAALIRQESSLRTKQIQETPRTNVFTDLGSLKFEGRLAVPGKSPEEAPSLDELAETAEAAMSKLELEGNLPAKVVVAINAFKSKSSGDVIYSLSVQLQRAVSILGSTEVVDATVASEEGVGRCPSRDAEEFILTQAQEMLARLRERIEAAQKR